MTDAKKSITRNAKKKATSLWKLAGSVESGWKRFWIKYQIVPTANMMSISGETSGSKIWKMTMLGKATQPRAPLRAKTPRCLYTAWRMPKDQRKRWRIRPFELVGATV